MATEKKTKKPASPLMYAIVLIMLAVLVYQNIVPTNMGAVYEKNVNDAAMITVTVTGGGENTSKSYNTEDQEKIDQFIDWADGKKMRIRSLADGISAAGAQVIKYNFAIKQQDGTYQQFVIDSRGYFHIAAEIYKFAGNMDENMSELDEILVSWQDDSEDNSEE